MLWRDEEGLYSADMKKAQKAPNQRLLQTLIAAGATLAVTGGEAKAASTAKGTASGEARPPLASPPAAKRRRGASHSVRSMSASEGKPG